MTSRVVSLSVVLWTVAGTAPAQTIPIQTVPLVPADQFDIFPSYTLAMGGVSIAVPEPPWRELARRRHERERRLCVRRDALVAEHERRRLPRGPHRREVTEVTAGRGF